MSGVKKTIDEKRVILENKLTHDAEAETYDIKSNYVKLKVLNDYVNGELEKIICSLLALRKTQYNVLDMGCGTGYITEKIYKNKQFKIDAVDISAKMLEQLKRKINNPYNVRIYQMEGVEFLQEIKNKKNYDLVIFSTFLHHLYDYEKVLEMATAILNSGGYIYILNEPFKRINAVVVVDMFIHYLLRCRKDLFYNISCFLFNRNIFRRYNKVIAEYHAFKSGINLDKILTTLMQTNIHVISERQYIVSNFDLTFRLGQKLKAFNNCIAIIGCKNIPLDGTV